MDRKLVRRKLAAILYADVAGYSRLTGEDEVGTHERLGAALDLIANAIEAGEGKVVHYIFAVQDEVTRNIVDALKVALTPDETRRIGERGTTSMEAYDLALRAREHHWRFTEIDNVEAVRLYQEAIAADPDFSYAHAGLAQVVTVDYMNGWNGATAERLDHGVAFAEKAIALNPSEPFGYLGGPGSHLVQGTRRAEAAARKANELEPDGAFFHAILAIVLAYQVRGADAIPHLESATRLDPNYPDINLNLLGIAHFVEGDCAAAARALERRIRRYPDTDASRALSASCYGHLGPPEDARAMGGDAQNQSRLRPRRAPPENCRTAGTKTATQSSGDSRTPVCPADLRQQGCVGREQPRHALRLLAAPATFRRDAVDAHELARRSEARAVALIVPIVDDAQQ